MDLPAISIGVRTVIWVITVIATALVGGLWGGLLQSNISYALRWLIPGEHRTGPRPTTRSPFTWAIFWISLTVAALGTAFASVAPQKVPVEAMTGDFRVVVSSFTSVESKTKGSLGEEMARNTFEQIDRTLRSIPTDLYIKSWGPDDLKVRQVKPVCGSDAAERTADAARLANALDADLVIYGTVEDLGTSIKFTPEFYVRVRNYFEADEITGQYYLGEPISLRGISDMSDRVAFNRQLSGRVEALANIIIGLAYYSLRDYPLALAQFQLAEKVKNWKPEEGQQVLYLLEADAVIRQGQPDLDLAENYFRKSLSIQSDYARPMVGLANVYYRKALLPMGVSNNKADLDADLMNRSIDLLKQALASSNQPPLADVPEKVHFELGQVYLMLAYTKHLNGYGSAIKEFQAVIDAYADGKNPRLKERAAESHARLGLIDYNMGNLSESISQYQMAVNLLADYPDQQSIYKERIENINKGQSVNQEDIK